MERHTRTELCDDAIDELGLDGVHDPISGTSDCMTIAEHGYAGYT
jgi:hypothetical protein